MLRFEDNPDAYCKWAKCHLDKAEAVRLLVAPLEDGTWTAAPARWIHHLSWPPIWETDTRAAVLDVRARLVHEITQGRLTDAAHGVLPGLVATSWTVPLQELPAILAWLLREAGANDATVVADVVQQALDARDDSLLPALMPLVGWLQTRGSRELRSSRRAQLAVALLPVVLQHGDDEQLVAAVRYVLWNETRVGTDGWGHQGILKLLPAVERLASQPGAGSVVGDLLETVTPELRDEYVRAVVRSPHSFPHSRADVLRRLGHGELVLHQASMIWALAVKGPAVDVALSSAAIARDAVDGLYYGNSAHADRASTMLSRERHAWGAILVREFIRLTDVLVTRNEPDVRSLQRCVSTSADLATNIREELRQGRDRDARALSAQMRALLHSPGLSPMVVDPALELLLGQPALPSQSSQSGDLTHVAAAIQEAASGTPPILSGFDLRHHLRGARRVQFAGLESERTFSIEGETFKVYRDAIAGLAATTTDLDQQRALGVLYAIHEVVHEFQGIAKKEDVSNVRFAGAESALMHVDLGADHIAASVTASLFPCWQLDWLKDLQGQSIRGFAAGPRNPPYSRIRKVLRLVGLRTDLALRRLGVARELMTPESYGFADFSPGGGTFVAMLNRPPFVVLRLGRITAKQVAVLFEGIEGRRDSIARVDAVIDEVLKQPVS